MFQCILMIWFDHEYDFILQCIVMMPFDNKYDLLQVLNSFDSSSIYHSESRCHEYWSFITCCEQLREGSDWDMTVFSVWILSLGGHSRRNQHWALDYVGWAPTPVDSSSKMAALLFLSLTLTLPLPSFAVATVLSFDGTQFLRISMQGETHTEAEDVSLRFQTLQANSLLLATTSSKTPDRLELMLEAGQLRLDVNLGSGSTVSTAFVITQSGLVITHLYSP